LGESGGGVYEAWKSVPEKRGSGIVRRGGCVRKIPRCWDVLVMEFKMKRKDVDEANTGMRVCEGENQWCSWNKVGVERMRGEHEHT